MKKISAKKLQFSFFLAFGCLILSLILLSMGQESMGLGLFVVAIFGVTLMMTFGQCPHCHNARSAKWVNPFVAGTEMYCTKCGKKMEIEDDGWVRLKYKESKKK